MWMVLNMKMEEMCNFFCISAYQWITLYFRSNFEWKLTIPQSYVFWNWIFLKIKRKMAEVFRTEDAYVKQVVEILNVPQG